MKFLFLLKCTSFSIVFCLTLVVCVTYKFYDKGHDGVYVGGMTDDELPHIFGLLRLLDGSSYHGQWHLGARCGRGLAVFSNGSYYEGQWMLDVYQGLGKYVNFESNEKYCGYWSWGTFNGEGLFVNSKGESFYGDWLNGQLVNGKPVHVDFKQFENTAENDLFWKASTQISTHLFKEYIARFMSSVSPTHTAIADSYVGDMVDGFFTGKGVRRYADGSVYDGDFIESQINGKGVYISKYGEIFDGNCKENEVCTGTIRNIHIFLVGCDRYEGAWKNFRPHGEGKVFCNGLLGIDTIRVIHDKGQLCHCIQAQPTLNQWNL